MPGRRVQSRMPFWSLPGVDDEAGRTDDRSLIVKGPILSHRSFRRDTAKGRKPAMHVVDPLYSIFGLVGGLLVGMTGVGGYGVIVPPVGPDRVEKKGRGAECLLSIRGQI